MRLLSPDDELLAEHDLDAPQARVDEEELRSVIADLSGVDVAGHRIVHGGERFQKPVRVDKDVLDSLRELTDLAPLHQPKSLAALDAVSRAPAVRALAAQGLGFLGIELDPASNETATEGAHGYG